MKRIFLLTITHLAVVGVFALVIYAIARTCGAGLSQSLVGALGVWAAIFGCGGALILLAIGTGKASRGRRRGAGGGEVPLAAQSAREAIEAVLGHEISDVVQGNRGTLASLQGVVKSFVIFLAADRHPRTTYQASSRASFQGVFQRALHAGGGYRPGGRLHAFFTERISVPQNFGGMK